MPLSFNAQPGGFSWKDIIAALREARDGAARTSASPEPAAKPAPVAAAPAIVVDVPEPVALVPPTAPTAAPVVPPAEATAPATATATATTPVGAAAQTPEAPATREPASPVADVATRTPSVAADDSLAAGRAALADLGASLLGVADRAPASAGRPVPETVDAARAAAIALRGRMKLENLISAIGPGGAGAGAADTAVDSLQPGQAAHAAYRAAAAPPETGGHRLSMAG
ncbi:hypothetical protein [Limimaricola hongkongensis]|uniref:Putative extensin protein n=1 Tax=Limimaricola hongkongensis DSM 17492 TaxID=1122180 RepID=A0A017H770_9RHOB|nr:hypothetical protein [Limimaricola hongkongensis]EYD70387.1 putative extensin protein precursor [Limimaricola hongkongensis DSM 17492]